MTTTRAIKDLFAWRSPNDEQQKTYQNKNPLRRDYISTYLQIVMTRTWRQLT